MLLYDCPGLRNASLQPHCARVMIGGTGQSGRRGNADGASSARGGPTSCSALATSGSPTPVAVANAGETFAVAAPTPAASPSRRSDRRDQPEPDVAVGST